MQEYWGKTNDGTYHLLSWHSLDVAACAITLLKRNDRLAAVLQHLLPGMDRDAVINLVGWAAALHDLGKLSPSFQRQDGLTSGIADLLGVPAISSPYDVRHDSLGWALWQSMAANVLPMGKIPSSSVLMRCATGHHGKPPDNIGNGTRIQVDRYFTQKEIQAAHNWASWATEYFAPQFPKAAGLNKASWWLAGVLTISDWLGSNVDWFPYNQDAAMDPADYMRNVALPNAERAITESGMAQMQARRSYSEIFPKYDPTPVQQAVIDLPIQDAPFLLVIEETTGGGKTEAALAAAGGSSFFFGLPTMATANGLFRRVGELDGQQTLIHGKRWHMPHAMDRAEAWLNDNGRKALLADIGVGTIDQAMIAVMHAKYSTLRLAGLAGKTLIIDEVHAYDPYMKQIIEVLIEMHACSGGSVILLSATMPLSHRQDYAAAWCRGRELPEPVFVKQGFPMVSFIDAQGTVSERDDLKSRYQDKSDAGRHVEVQFAHSSEEIIRNILLEARQGKCAAWIRNTVGEAIEAYESLKQAGADVMLFHSRFTIGDRMAKEKAVMDTFGKDSDSHTRPGKILVATQVIEQSLDVDFDFMVTDLCPIDLLIQRAGRLHRHDREIDRGTPVLMVYAPQFSETPDQNWISSWSAGTGYVYPDHGKLWLTASLIQEGFTLPGDARRLVEGVYDCSAEIPEGLSKRSIEFIGKCLAQASQGEFAAINTGLAYQKDGAPVWDDLVAPTRLGEATREWVVFEQGAPVSGTIDSSSLQVPVSRLTQAPVASVEVGKWQETINLHGGMAGGAGPRGPVTIRYDSEMGLRLEESRH